MTKITVIGEAPKEEKKLKPIELIGLVLINGKEIKAERLPTLTIYNDVRVLKVMGYNFDCILYCITHDGVTDIYTANFNDGVAE